MCLLFFFFPHQMWALKLLWKMPFISSKQLFSFSRYSNFCVSDFCSFFPFGYYFRRWLQINIKVCDFTKNYTEIVHQTLVADPFLILVNNPNQLLYARNSFKNRILWKRIIKKRLKKVNFIFFLLNAAPFNGKMKNKMCLEIMTSCPSGYNIHWWCITCSSLML